MSTIQDIMAELQAGQEAQRKVPELEQVIADLKKQLNSVLEHNQALELRAKDRDATINSMQAKIRSLEVERDDVGFRLLEAEDRFNSLLEAVRPIWSSLGRAIEKALPPEPVKEVAPQPAETKTSTPQPTVGFPNNPVPGTEPAKAEGQSAAGEQSAGSQGQSETRPTVPDGSAETGNAASSSGASETKPASPQPTTESQQDWKPSVEIKPFQSDDKPKEEPKQELPSWLKPQG